MKLSMNGRRNDQLVELPFESALFAGIDCAPLSQLFLVVLLLPWFRQSEFHQIDLTAGL